LQKNYSTPNVVLAQNYQKLYATWAPPPEPARRAYVQRSPNTLVGLQTEVRPPERRIEEKKNTGKMGKV